MTNVHEEKLAHVYENPWRRISELAEQIALLSHQQEAEVNILRQENTHLQRALQKIIDLPGGDSLHRVMQKDIARMALGQTPELIWEHNPLAE